MWFVGRLRCRVTLLTRPPLPSALLDSQGTPEYATILAFDVKIDSDARRHADETGVRIFTADIIYHLFDQFTAHMDRLMEQRRQDARDIAVFPCICKVCREELENNAGFACMRTCVYGFCLKLNLAGLLRI